MARFAGRLWQSSLVRAFLLAIIWQIIITLLGLVFSHSFPIHVERDQIMPGLYNTLNYMTHWDGQWYLSIINGSYIDPQSFSPAFFPLFPLIIGILKIVTFGLIDITVLALLFNTVTLAFSLYFLRGISRQLFKKTNQWILPLIFLSAPAAIFQNFFYTEALFCAISFGAYYFVLKRRWLVMSILLVAATATRLPGVLVVILCALEYLRVHQWSIQQSLRDRSILTFFIAPLGLILYSAYLFLVRHDAIAMIHSERLWSYHVLNLNIFQTVLNSMRGVAHSFSHGLTFDCIFHTQ